MYDDDDFDVIYFHYHFSLCEDDAVYDEEKHDFLCRTNRQIDEERLFHSNISFTSDAFGHLLGQIHIHWISIGCTMHRLRIVSHGIKRSWIINHGIASKSIIFINRKEEKK